jgi:hypothetical protein
MNDKENQTKAKAPSLIQVIGSVLSAGFGVQNSENRERDFQHGNFPLFVAVGIAATVLLILTIYTVVSIVV